VDTSFPHGIKPIAINTHESDLSSCGISSSSPAPRHTIFTPLKCKIRRFNDWIFDGYRAMQGLTRRLFALTALVALFCAQTVWAYSATGLYAAYRAPGKHTLRIEKLDIHAKIDWSDDLLAYARYHDDHNSTGWGYVKLQRANAIGCIASKVGVGCFPFGGRHSKGVYVT